LTDRDGLNGPELKAHEWQPRIWCLMVTVPAPLAGAAAVTTSAYSAASARAAPRLLCLRCMTSPSFADVGVSFVAMTQVAIRLLPQTRCGFPARGLRRARMHSE
jgi:hypothetical protein